MAKKIYIVQAGFLPVGASDVTGWRSHSFYAGRTIWKPLHVCTFRLMLSSGAVRLTRKTAASTTAMFFLTASCQIADTSLELATGAMLASGPETSRARHRQCGACGRASLRTASPHGLRWRKSTSMLRKCSGARFTDRRSRPCSTLPMMRSCGTRMLS